MSKQGWVWAVVLALLVGPPSLASTHGRELVQREVVITDDNADEVQVLRVAYGMPLTLTFSQPLRPGAMLADNDGSFAVPQQKRSSLLIYALRDLRRGAMTTLTVSLEDGTTLVFKLISDRKVADVRVHVDVDLVRRATVESPAVLKALNDELRSELDACHSMAGEAGIRKVAALALQQDAGKSAAFTVERRRARRIDKQSRLLVETETLYRLFDHSYLVLSVKNRHPNQVWVMDAPRLEAKGPGGMRGLEIFTYDVERQQLAPDETLKMVIVFKSPPEGVVEQLVVHLREKNGSRHVALAGVRL
ncbi:MAG TPA: DUF2381 family protein [Myxococcaceae bacterium]|nr:DUF2381 family protein [Myxococcaceae bacterium]